MATAVTPRARPASASTQPADAFVAFGITGDLAKVMTLRSLYRLERRGLLTCPIVGVAIQDWTDDDLRAHARKCIEDTGETIDPAVFDRFAARLSYAPPPVHPYAPGTWGPAEADRLLAGHGRWHEPWVTT